MRRYIPLCDKIGIGWFLLAYFGLYALAEDKSAALDFFFSWMGLRYFILIGMSVWFIARFVDWCHGGPEKREARFIGRMIGY